MPGLYKLFEILRSSRNERTVVLEKFPFKALSLWLSKVHSDWNATFKNLGT